MKLTSFWLALCGLCTGTLYAQLSIQTGQTPQQLADELTTVPGMCSNAQIIGSPLSVGIFNNANSAVSIGSGIFLTTGLAADFSGVPINSQSGFTSAGPGTPGDAALNSLVAPFTTNDASGIEFDFIALEDSLFLRYIFASEEYEEYQCSDFNDVFAIFLSGPGYASPVNIAKVPNTNRPVTINTINSGVVGSFGTMANCAATLGSLAYSNYFVNNQNGPFVEFDGMTTTLTARAQLVPGQIYHLKIAVADAFDSAFDSGIFLETGSLNFGALADTFEYVIQSNPTRTDPVEGCSESHLRIEFLNPLDSNYTLPFAVWGTATNGQDYELLDSSDFTILMGDSVLFVPITPLSDGIADALETVYIAVQTTPWAWDTTVVYLQDPLDSVGVQVGISTLACLAAGIEGYQWIDCANNYAPLWGETDSVYYLSQTGSYAVVTERGGCLDTSDCVQIAVATISGRVFNTLNTGICDTTQAMYLPIPVQLNPTGQIVFADSWTGEYAFGVSVLDTYSVKLLSIPGYYLPLCPGDSMSVVVNNFAIPYDTCHFYLSIPDTIHDLSVYLIGSTPPIATQQHWTTIFVCNHGGSLQTNGTVTLDVNSYLGDWQYYYSSPFQFVSADTANDVLVFSFDTLEAGVCRTIEMVYQLPNTVPQGSVATQVATVTSGSIDNYAWNNTYSISEPILAAYDPNMKSSNHSGEFFYLEEGAELRYTIHFQNTGTAPAHDVVLRDTLDAWLRPLDIQQIVSSHPCQVELEGGNILVVRFLGINLPDSASDYAGSMGYFHFSIPWDESIQPGTFVYNKAGIYFDFNPPIITNTVATEFVEAIWQTTDLVEQTSSLRLYPNPNQGQATIEYQLEETSAVRLSVYDLLGRCVWEQSSEEQAAGRHIQPLSWEALPEGMYWLQWNSGSKQQAIPFVKR